MKRMISLVLVLLLCVTMSSSVFAEKIFISENALLINTKAVPLNATKYAIQIFSAFDMSTFNTLGFEINEGSDIALSPGFCMVDDTTSEYIENLYHFLISSNDKFVGVLIISYTNGEYGFQVSKAPFVDGINNLNNNTLEPYEITCSEVGHFCRSENDIFVLSASKTASQDEINNYTVSSSKPTQVNNLQALSTVNVFEPIYETTIDSNSVGNSTSFVLGVPYCGNHEIYGQGVCWASAAASVIVYKLRGVFYEAGEAEEMRDTIVNNRIETAGTYTGTITTMRDYINLALIQDYYIYGAQLPFINIVTLIDAASPCAIELAAVGSNTTYGHAAVIAGYSYVPNQTSSQMYYIMDPNCTSTFIGVGYSSVYYTSPYYIIPGVDYFVWVDTIIDGDDLS